MAVADRAIARTECPLGSSLSFFLSLLQVAPGARRSGNIDKKMGGAVSGPVLTSLGQNAHVWRMPS